jgi:hypothetical protein
VPAEPQIVDTPGGRMHVRWDEGAAATPHGRTDVLKRLIANIGAALLHLETAVEQFKDLDRWGCLLRYISDRIAPIIGPPKPPPRLAATA